MNTTIENEYLHVAIQSKGAELTQIKGKQDGIDYLWSADPTYWAGHAPILFPIVGRVYDGQYHVNGQSFSLGTHGFAKDYDFMVAEHTSNRVTYQLTSDESTQKNISLRFHVIYYLYAY